MPSEIVLAKPIAIAVDGPAGSGKSSVSRLVAARLGARYLDTGAMYRAMTWAMLRDGIDIDDPSAIAAHASVPVITNGTDPQAPTIEVDGVDVAVPIRSVDINTSVSPVSAVPDVRQRLVQLQRNAVDAAREAGVGIVVEGRDIGTVVLPDAPLKIFLTADPQVRGRRRAAEVQHADQSDVDAQTVAREAEELSRRDALDSTRKESPLAQATDAVVIDTTHLSLEQVVGAVIAHATERAEQVRA